MNSTLKKSSQLNLDLKTESGFISRETHYISLNQWTRIKEILGETSTDHLHQKLLLNAAAPDLLQACHDFVLKVDRGEARSTKSYNQMKKAIDKAIGRI